MTDQIERLYVVAAYYQHFLYWCEDRRLPAHDRRLVYLSRDNHTRLLLGTYRPRFYVYSLPQDYQGISDHLMIVQAEHVDFEQLDEWIAAFRGKLGQEVTNGA